MDHACRSAFPFFYPLLIANIDDAFTPYCNRSRGRLSLICGEDVCVSDDDVSIVGHMQSPDIYSCGIKYCSTIRLKGCQMLIIQFQWAVYFPKIPFG
jgi:hypothetical protein